MYPIHLLFLFLLQSILFLILTLYIHSFICCLLSLSLSILIPHVMGWGGLCYYILHLFSLFVKYWCSCWLWWWWSLFYSTFQVNFNNGGFLYTKYFLWLQSSITIGPYLLLLLLHVLFLCYHILYFMIIQICQEVANLLFYFKFLIIQVTWFV